MLGDDWGNGGKNTGRECATDESEKIINILLYWKYFLMGMKKWFICRQLFIKYLRGYMCCVRVCINNFLILWERNRIFFLIEKFN